MDAPASPPRISSYATNMQSLVSTLVRWNNAGELGKLSALRSWWRPSAHYIAYPVMGSLIGGHRLDKPVWTTIPALFALHRRHTEREFFNFGATCRSLALDPMDPKDAFAAHFRRLLACDEDESLEDVSLVLRRLTQRAAAKTPPVEINYVKLGFDLLLWQQSPDKAREVKTRWAQAYYRADTDEAEQPTAPPPPAP